MSDQAFKPYVPAEQSIKEISFKAILLGIIMAIILGAANAYLGLLVGMTVAATFPAAVIAMAVEYPSIKWLDDDMLMQVAPAGLLTLVSLFVFAL